MIQILFWIAPEMEICKLCNLHFPNIRLFLSNVPLLLIFSVLQGDIIQEDNTHDA